MAASPAKKNGQEGTTFDWPFSFEVLKDRTLEIDEVYQRPLGQFVEEIVETFEPAMIGTLLVNKRGGKFYVIDGQHRLVALRRLGIQDVPCVVYDGLSRQDEAKLFARLQTQRRRIRPAQRWKAEVVAKTPRAVAINKVFTDLGIQVADIGGRLMAPHELSAVVAVERIYDNHGAQRLETVIRVIRSAWPDEKGALANDLLLGVSSFIAKENPDEQRLIERLSTVTAWEIKQRSSALRQGRGVGGGSPAYTAEAIGAIYRRRHMRSET